MSSDIHVQAWMDSLRAHRYSPRTIDTRQNSLVKFTGFLEDQGNWYTPFNHPGMTGRYDIRGWHRHGSENQ